MNINLKEERSGWKIYNCDGWKFGRWMEEVVLFLLLIFFCLAYIYKVNDRGYNVYLRCVWDLFFFVYIKPQKIYAIFFFIYLKNCLIRNVMYTLYTIATRCWWCVFFILIYISFDWYWISNVIRMKIKTRIIK